MEKTLIQVSNKTWKQLNDYKTSDAKTFEEVIIKLIKGSKKNEKTQ